MKPDSKQSDPLPPYLQLNDRPNRSLDGQWGFYADNMGAFGLKRSRNIFEGLKPTEEDRAVEYDVDAFEQISVPGDWNTQRKEFLLFEGYGWYARRLDLTPSELQELKQSARIFLCLEGVNYAVDAWWNGEQVGSAEVPFLPLSFELKPELVREKNLIVMRVDARRLPHRIPSEKYDWFNYGGLIRSVRILSTPNVFISQAACHQTEILSRKGDQAKINSVFRVEIDGVEKQEGYTLQIDLPELDYSRSIKVNRASTKLKLSGLDVTLWQPGRPTLYDAVITLLKDGEVVDRISQRIGFKQVTCCGTELLVNEEPFTLKGIALHEERLGAEGGKPRNLEDIRKLIDLAQETGCNFLRLAHYPYDEAWLRECDERGLLIWDEIPVYWEITYTDKRTEKIIHDSAVRMVEVSRGHPSVLCHALANETWELPGRKRVMGRAFKAVKRLDPDIPATAAFNAPYRDNIYDIESVGHSIYDFCDVIGLNEYGGWYSPPAKELPQASIKVGDKPIFVTEFGAAGPLETHGPDDELWNLESQQRIYEEQLRLFARTEGLSGWTPWAFKDFRSTLRANGFQHGWNRKGLVGPQGEKKPIFELVKKAFNLRS